MFVRSLKFSCFRNLETAVLTPGPRFNVFSGNNGQGKTNILEALYAVCTLRSFRSSRLRDLIHIDQEKAYIEASVHSGALERRYELTIGLRSRVAKLDKKTVRPIARYFGHFNVVLFAPEDLLVAKGTPSEKRRFLDRAIFTLKPSFLGVAQDFEKILKNRNIVLRDEHLGTERQEELLCVYDEQFSSLSAQVLVSRLTYLQKIEPRFTSAFASITHSTLQASLCYEHTNESNVVQISSEQLSLQTCTQNYRNSLLANRKADMRRGSTTIGPHRDLLRFRLSSQPVETFASQGQLRAMILAWKTAEMDLLEQAHKEAPILLLDDVSSELDPQRNAYLFDFLRSRENQCFISTTHPNFVLLSNDRQDFLVENGKVIPTSKAL